MNKYTNTFPEQVTVFDKQCFGCEQYEKDVMLTFSYTDKSTDVFHINDIFLTNEQALRLIDDLSAVVKRNAEK